MRLFALDAAGGGGPDEGAADASAPPMPDEAPPEREDTFFLPPDFPGKDGYKPGDTITLKVVGSGRDGELEVECQPDEKGTDNSQDWKTDLRDNVPTTPG